MHCVEDTEEGPSRGEPPHSWERAGATQEPSEFREVARHSERAERQETPLGAQLPSLPRAAPLPSGVRGPLSLSLHVFISNMDLVGRCGIRDTRMHRAP